MSCAGIPPDVKGLADVPMARWKTESAFQPRRYRAGETVRWSPASGRKEPVGDGTPIDNRMRILQPVRSCGNGTMALRGRRHWLVIDGLGGPSYKTSDFNRFGYISFRSKSACWST